MGPVFLNWLVQLMLTGNWLKKLTSQILGLRCHHGAEAKPQGSADHIHFHIHRLVPKRPQGSALLSTVYKASAREYPDKIWPTYMVQYLYFSNLKFPLIRVNSDYLGFDSFLIVLHSILSLSIDTIIIIIIIQSIHYTISLWVNIILTIIHYNIFHMIYHLIYHSI